LGVRGQGSPSASRAPPAIANKYKARILPRSYMQSGGAREFCQKSTCDQVVHEDEIKKRGTNLCAVLLLRNNKRRTNLFLCLFYEMSSCVCSTKSLPVFALRNNKRRTNLCAALLLLHLHLGARNRLLQQLPELCHLCLSDYNRPHESFPLVRLPILRGWERSQSRVTLNPKP
jgi:hypothetical protein